MTRSLLKYDRESLILFLLIVIHPLITFVFQVQGVFLFAAAKIANRIWAVVILIVIIMNILNVKNNIAIVKYKGFLFGFGVVSIIFMGLIWGILLGNRIAYIIADFVLILFLPFLYSMFARSIYWKGRNKVERFLRDYFRINVFFTLLITLPLFIVGYSVLVDLVFVSAIVLAILLSTKKKKVFVINIIFLIILLIIGASKTLLLQVLLCLLVGLRRNLRKAMQYVLFFALISIVFLNLFGEIVSNSWVYEKSRLFLQSINVLMEQKPRISDVLDSPFAYLDASTGQRVLELKKVIDKISHSAETMLLGYGLGADISLVETQDFSVALSHGGYDALKSVRVIHLGIAFILLKLGLVGLVLYITFNIWLALRAVKLIQNSFSYLDLGIGFALLMYILGAQFTFANYLKMPTFWILFVISGIFESHKNRM